MKDVATRRRHRPDAVCGPRSRRWGRGLVIAVTAVEVSASIWLPDCAHRDVLARPLTASTAGGAGGAIFSAGVAMVPPSPPPATQPLPGGAHAVAAPAGAILAAGVVTVPPSPPPTTQPSPALARAADDGSRRQLPTNSPAPTASVLADTPRPSAQPSRGQRALTWALTQIGKPYVWGAQGPDAFDCSGLTFMAWRAAGVDIARTSQGQWRTLPRVLDGGLRPGDLIVFYNASHVALYAGAGMVVQAPRAGRRVSLAKMAAMPVLGVVRPG